MIPDDNVERFLMGRQVCVVFLVFLSAKLTTIHLAEVDEEFLFPAPHWFRVAFLESGLLACVIVVIVAQLMPQIVAAKYPVHFVEVSAHAPVSASETPHCDFRVARAPIALYGKGAFWATVTFWRSVREVA